MVGLETVLVIANGAVAIATGLLALFTWRLASATRKAVDLTRQQALSAEATASATTRAADAAADAARQAARSRSEDRAPRIIALVEEPSWPPLLDRSRRGMPQANELRLLNATSVARSELASDEYIFDQDRDCFLWLRMRGILSNEGSATARVRLGGESQFIDDHSPFVPTDVPIPVPQCVGPRSRGEYLLRPGEHAVFEWAAGHTLGEWSDAYLNPDPPNPKGALFLEVTVFDFFDEGIVDKIFIETAGRPVIPVSSRSSHWRVTDEPNVGTVVYPCIRWFRSEGESLPSPPWAARYSTS